MKPRNWEHEHFFPKVVETTDFGMVSLWISFFLAGTFFFGGGGGGPRSFWSCQAFFRSCYLRYQCQSSDYCKSRLNPGVCSYRGVFPYAYGPPRWDFRWKNSVLCLGNVVTICNNSRIVHIEPHLTLKCFMTDVRPNLFCDSLQISFKQSDVICLTLGSSPF